MVLNTIENTDAISYLKRIKSNSVDLILTDIPYGECDIDNNGLWDKNTNMKDMHIADTVNFDLEELLSEYDRVCTSSMYIFCGIEQVSMIKKYYSDKKYTTRLVIWEKTNPMPINGKYVYLSGIETCVWIKKSKGTFNASCKNTVFRHPISGNGLHPTMKPVELFKQFILISSNKGDTVLDTFMGSGTTAIAAKTLGRNYIGCELNQDYYTIILDRLKPIQKESDLASSINEWN